jgi:hypothetical protein
MCMPTQTDVVGFFRTLEPVFLCYWVVIAFCLVNPRKKFEAKIAFLNTMLKKHHLEGKVTVTEKAVQNFRRDKWILFFLILVVLLLIQKI